MKTFVKSVPHLIAGGMGIGAVSGLAATGNLGKAVLTFIGTVVGALIGAGVAKAGAGSSVTVTTTPGPTPTTTTVSRQN